MSTLSTDLRNKLERTVVEARDAAEAGARAALEALAVHHHEPYPHMNASQRDLRNQLRARARQLGDRQEGGGRLALRHLVSECAYEHWHRMLFARFLAENHLLIEPEENMAISLAEAEELAKEEGVDVWVYASRCAQRMLPQIFRPEDPLLQVSLPVEHMLELEGLLASLPPAVFCAADALGWVYQFWQSKKKDEVNRSEVKIGADELPAVTQLFTEPYMVSFLLHNTLGAWWAGKKLTAEDAENAEGEEELRRKLALPGVGWEYLRFVRDEPQTNESSSPSSSALSASSAVQSSGPWRPAAGTFEGWPGTAAELKVLDPCCGSGHFLVAGLHHLVPIRMAEEGLSAAEAVDAVLRDSLHGLEIDERCCQIAAFALAFAAWTYPNLPASDGVPLRPTVAGTLRVPSASAATDSDGVPLRPTEAALGYRELPELHIACTGIGPQCSAEQWVKLAEESGIPMPRGGREPIENGLLNLHGLFTQAPTLGSLIDHTDLPRDLIAADYETIKPYLAAVLRAEKADDETRERAIAAAGMVKAADLLAGEYTLVVTNVPYLGRPKQDTVLRDYCEEHHPSAKADVATCFVERGNVFAAAGGTIAMVTPQNWLSQDGYKVLRHHILKTLCWHAVVRLGEKGFESPQAAGAFAAMIEISQVRPGSDQCLAVLDLAAERGPREKQVAISVRPMALVEQAEQLANPDSIVTLERLGRGTLLSQFAYTAQGFATSDNPPFIRSFWEFSTVANGWVFAQSAPQETTLYTGRCDILLWEEGSGAYYRHAMALKAAGRLGGWKSGYEAWRKQGVLVAELRNMPATLYSGDMFDHTAHAIVPRSPRHLAALWAFCMSDEFREAVRKVSPKLNVTNETLVKVPFDLEYWQTIANEDYPDGHPEPESDDPTQWLFHGRPDEAQEGTQLQVAVARLLGYRWPAELDNEMRLSKRARLLLKKCGELARFADDDGIVCIPAVRGEEPAADRLLRLLGACAIQPTADLDDWLRNGFFEQHCKLFHDRPFVWHIWDGRKRDGFHALVNYHKLAEGGGQGRKLLESLTYSYLGDWIARQKDGVRREEGGAEDRLAAALELQKRLEAILAGEPPFDIFVRWKPLSEQPLGWEPDINDGVRLNIRPFLASDLPGGRAGAGILRFKPNVKWTKDRGKEPERPKDQYPWFWGWDEKTPDFKGGKKFDGNRWNDCHYSNQFKQQAR